MNARLVAYRVALPCEVPPGGLAVILIDGRIAPRNAVHGPGRVRPEPWRKEGEAVEAVIFSSTRLRLRFDVDGLRSKEGVRLSLTVSLSLYVEDPERFLADAVRDRRQLSESELVADLHLKDLVRSGLATEVRMLSLDELNANQDLRAWLGAAVLRALENARLTERSGLTLEGLDAYDVRCEVWDRVQNAREFYYLEASLGQEATTARKPLSGHIIADLKESSDGTEDTTAHTSAPPCFDESEKPCAMTEGRATTRHAFYQNTPLEPYQGTTGEFSQARPGSSHKGGHRLDGLWRVFCPRCLRVTSESVCPGCGWRRSYGAPVIPVRPQLQLQSRVGGTFGGLSLVDDLLCITTEDGQVVLVSKWDLQEQRRFQLIWQGKGWLPSPQVASDERHIYLGCAHPDALGEPAPLIAVRRDTLTVEWGFRTSGTRVSSPAVYGSTVYAADRKGRAWAITAAGMEAWPQSKPIGAPCSSQPPAVDEELVVFPSQGPKIVALDRQTGEVRWQYETSTSGATLCNTPVIKGDRVYVAGGDGYLVCLGRRDGHIIWQFRCEGDKALLTSPLVIDSMILVGSEDGRLHAIYDRGDRCESAWSYRIGGGGEKRICSRPVVIEDAVYVAGDDKQLHAVERGTGRALWDSPLPLGERVRAALATDGWHVIVVGVRGSVWAVPRHVSPLQSATYYEAEGCWDLAIVSHIAARNLRGAAKLASQRLGIPKVATTLLKEVGDEDSALELCRQLGDHRQEAQILAEQERFKEAGDVIRIEAERREAETQGRAEEELAELWELADDYYRRAGLHEAEEPRRNCRQKVIYYRRQPDLHVDFEQPDRPFVVGEACLLKLTIRNMGRGEARNARIALTSAVDALRGELEAGPQTIQPLGGRWEPSLNIIPQQPGSIKVTCSLKYEEGSKQWCMHQSWEIKVQPSGNQPLHVSNVDTFIYSPGDTYIVGGDLLKEGAQKGDRVTINRGNRAEGQATRLLRCRHCQKNLAPGAAYCDHCREPV